MFTLFFLFAIIPMNLKVPCFFFIKEAVRPKGGVRMNKYEIMFIVRANLEEKEIKDAAKTYESLLKDMKAGSVSLKDLGSKKFANPIQKEVRGNYYLLNTECNASTIIELNRRMKIDERILRYLITKEEE